MATKAFDNAKRNKADEFYTRLEDIEKELKYYKEQLKDKVIFCNCDDPYESNFFKYFAMNFNFLGLKKLIATCYDNSPVAYTQLNCFGNDVYIKNNCKHAYKIEITEVKDYNKDGATDLSDVELLLKSDKNSMKLLKGNGDFRSEECIELLKEADIVVTNPPFSLLGEYVQQLMAYSKLFLIVGNQNAITYKEIFPLIKENLIWLGYNYGAQDFIVPNNLERKNTYVKNGIKYAKFGNICWFTNLYIHRKCDYVPLYRKYDKNYYAKFDNYNAINVDKVADIPCDYDGYMGVPITILNKYNPYQFEIIDAINRYALLDVMHTNERVKRNRSHTCNINGKAKFFRIIIKRRNKNEN